jgi:hypothetical protein
VNVLDLFSGIGGEIMPRGAKPKQYHERFVARVRELYGSGLTQAEIAAQIGRSQKVIWNCMRRHGITARLAAKRDQRGEKNSYWKADAAGKQAFHRRLYALYGKPTKCTVCRTTESEHYDYANLSGRYEDINDYAAMCRSCHCKYDDKITNITGKGGML